MITIQAAPINTLIISDFPAIGLGLTLLIDAQQPTLSALGLATCLADVPAVVQEAVPHVVIVDIDGGLGLDTIEKFNMNSDAKLLAFTGSSDQATHDALVMAGALGIVNKREPPEVLFQAIETIHAGELWLDRRSIARIVQGLSGKKPKDQGSLLDSLTSKEQKVVDLVVKCISLNNREIAGQLNISENTLRNHLTSIYAKLGLSNRLELFVLLNNGRDGQSSKNAALR